MKPFNVDLSAVAKAKTLARAKKNQKKKFSEAGFFQTFSNVGTPPIKCAKMEMKTLTIGEL